MLARRRKPRTITLNMKSTPILMTGPNVLRILDDSKTHTRRIMKPQPFDGFYFGKNGVAYMYYPLKVNKKTGEAYPGKAVFGVADADQDFKCPYGRPGDEIWVKETFAYTDHSINIKPGWVYRATDPEWGTEGGLKWKPAIFMPRAASRITLKLKAVRVERLQDISEEDAIAEGCKAEMIHAPGCKRTRFDPGLPDCYMQSAKMAFRELWESINGSGSWNSNPWVWVLAFERKTDQPLDTRD